MPQWNLVLLGIWILICAKWFMFVSLVLKHCSTHRSRKSNPVLCRIVLRCLSTARKMSSCEFDTQRKEYVIPFWNTRISYTWSTQEFCANLSTFLALYRLSSCQLHKTLQSKNVLCKLKMNSEIAMTLLAMSASSTLWKRMKTKH